MSSDEIQIMDYYYYGTSTYTTQNNLILSELPSEFECSFIIRPQSERDTNTGILSTQYPNGELYVGNISSWTIRATLYPTSATGQAQNMSLSTGTETNLIWKYENGVHTLTNGTNTISLTGYAPSNLKCSATSNCYIKNIKIKQL